MDDEVATPASDSGSGRASLLANVRGSLRELAIVMFGVLIALWVTNWNERRKEAGLEQAYLVRLLADLQRDTVVLRRMISLSDAKAANLDTLERQFRLPAGQAFDTLQFLHAIAGASRLAFANPAVSRTTFSELENTGSLRLIADPQLRSDIARYYTTAMYSDTRINERRTPYGPLSYQLVPQTSGVLDEPPRSEWNRLVRNARLSNLEELVLAERNFAKFFRQRQSSTLEDAKELLQKIEHREE